MNELKAIETRYRGHRFRSRTEARWAVFFDALGVEWEYEKEGFELPSGRYLPDFWLPCVQVGCWLEIKGQSPTDREKSLARELAISSGFPVYIFAMPARAELKTYSGVDFRGRSWDEQVILQAYGMGFFPNGPVVDKQKFLICGDCEAIGITGGECYLPCQDDGLFVSPARKALLDRANRTLFQEELISRHCDCKGLQLRPQQQRLKNAFDKASSARFEFGESG